MVFAASAAELKDAETWWGAVGSSPSVTFVTLDASGEEEVLLEGPKAPRMAHCHNRYTGDAAPRRQKLPAGVTDDEPAPQQATKPAFAEFRITVAKAFADAGLFARARDFPPSVPALVLGDTVARHVVTTKGARDYTTEVTCVAVVAAAGRELVEKLVPPAGAFVALQRSSAVPRWFRTATDEDDDAYYKRVRKVCTDTSGRMVFRPSPTAPLGIVANGDLEGADARRWVARRTPPEWSHADQLQTWATARGFTAISGGARLSQRVWAFRANVASQQQAFSFASGVTVALAAGSAAAGGKKDTGSSGATAGRTFRPQWGAPPPKQAADPSADTDTPTRDEVSATQPDAPTQGTSPPANTQPGAAAGSSGAAAATTTDPPTKRSRSEVPPFRDLWDEVDNDGNGDCAYISVARGLHAASGSRRTSTEKDFEAKGSLQASLRMLAAAELAKHPKKYKVDADYVKRVSAAGNAIDSIALRALAEATNTEILVWAHSAALRQWTLYRPPSSAAKKWGKTVWLSLRDRHYRWLRPKESQPSDTAQRLADFRRQAFQYPTGGVPLGGGGLAQSKPPTTPRSACLSDRAASLLGLPKAGRAAAASTRRAPSASGRPAARASTRGQSAAASLLGLPRAPDTADDPGVPGKYTQGDGFRCVCGWKPSSTIADVSRRGNDIRRQAVRHWGRCQGTTPEPPRPDVRRARYQALGFSRVQRRRDDAFAAYAQWRAALPASVREDLCTFLKDSLETRAGPQITAAMWSCSRCGRTKKLSDAKKAPCARRTSGKKRAEVLAIARGQPWEARRHSQERECATRNGRGKQVWAKLRQRLQDPAFRQAYTAKRKLQASRRAAARSL